MLLCSDGRAPSESVFDRELGGLFTMLTVGKVSDDDAFCRTEYAVEHLGTRVTVVIGDVAWRAVKTAHEMPEGLSVGMPALDGLVRGMHPRPQQICQKMFGLI